LPQTFSQVESFADIASDREAFSSYRPNPDSSFLGVEFPRAAFSLLKCLERFFRSSSVVVQFEVPDPSGLCRKKNTSSRNIGDKIPKEPSPFFSCDLVAYHLVIQQLPRDVRSFSQLQEEIS
jgi:hypothetical protein